MKKWLRRLAYLLILLLWAAIMLLPVGAFTLARNGQFTLGNTRVFLIQTQDQAGIGFQTTREVQREVQCVRSSVRYLMWEGEGENFADCSQCVDGIERVPSGGQCIAP